MQYEERKSIRSIVYVGSIIENYTLLQPTLYFNIDIAQRIIFVVVIILFVSFVLIFSTLAELDQLNGIPYTTKSVCAVLVQDIIR